MRRKQILILVLLLLTVLCLAGCKSTEVRNAEAAIDRIGEVSLASADDIETAREAYEALSANDRSKVENYQVLEDAEDAFLDAEIAYVDSTIDEIGDVTLESASKIRTARNVYESVSSEAQDRSRNQDALYAAEEELARLEENAAAQSVQEYIDQGRYEDAVKAASAYCDAHNVKSASEETAKRFAEAYIGLAKQYESESEIERAFSTLNGFKGKYNFPDGDPVAAAEEALKERLRASEPANGAVLSGNCQGGYAEFTIKNSDGGALIKLESVNDPNVFLTMYVRDNQTATVHVKDGTYILKYATGEQWYSAKELFGQSTQYNKADQNVELTTVYSGNSVQYSSVTITLYKVMNGNLSTSRISENDF